MQRIINEIIVALVSGCGSQRQDDGSSSRGRKVLSKAEIQELTDLVVVDAEENSDYIDEDYWGEEVEGIITMDSDSNSHFTYVRGYRRSGEDDEEEDEEDEMILVQISADHKILREFSEDEIALHPGKRLSFRCLSVDRFLTTQISKNVI